MHHVWYGFLPDFTIDENTTIPENRTHSFIKYFKDNGYIIGRAADYPEASPLYPNNDTLK